MRPTRHNLWMNRTAFYAVQRNIGKDMPDWFNLDRADCVLTYKLAIMKATEPVVEWITENNYRVKHFQHSSCPTPGGDYFQDQLHLELNYEERCDGAEYVKLGALYINDETLAVKYKLQMQDDYPITKPDEDTI